MTFDSNCSYCAEGKLLDAFGIKIGELPMSKVILFKEQSHRAAALWSASATWTTSPS